MIRQNIILGEYIYIADLYKANIDLFEPHIPTQKYVMLRKFDIINEVCQDTDIFFIERETAKQMAKDIANNTNSFTDTVVFPTNETGAMSFSAWYNNFDTDYTIDTLTYDEETDTFGPDVYELYDSNKFPDNSNITTDEIHKSLANIICDTVRIYQPANKPHIDAIIYVDNYINDIHFHYFSSIYNKQPNNSETEFIIDTFKYSEYIEFNIPNIETLFNEINNDNINTDIVFVDFVNNIKYLDAVLTNDFTTDYNKEYICNNESIIFTSLSKMLLPYKVTKTTENNEELAIKSIVISNKALYQKNYLNSPVNITIYPYSEFNTDLGLYMANINLLPNSDTFVIPTQFTLSSKMGFINGKISVINTFNYPNQHLFKDIKEAYSIYNNVHPYNYAIYPYIILDYDDFVECLNDDTVTVYEYTGDKDIDEFTDMQELKNTFRKNLTVYSSTGKLSTEEWKDRPLRLFKNILENDEYEDNFNNLDTDLNCCGYHIRVASDKELKNIIYKLDTEENFIDDYAFNLNNLFNKWDNLPELLVINTTFIDKYLGNYIFGNDVVITKEWFKYFINDITDYRITDLQKKQNYENMDYNNGFNFIDKITCVINKENETKPNVYLEKDGDKYYYYDKYGTKTEFNGQVTDNIHNGNSSPRILYKPIFYRTQELQTIKLKTGLTQNVGINLGSYMTKVDTFKLTINGVTYIEVSRNDIYVIFNINAANVSYDSTYYISDQDDNYISDGSCVLY